MNMIMIAKYEWVVREERWIAIFPHHSWSICLILSSGLLFFFSHCHSSSYSIGPFSG
jgi:hypothetical protein